MMRKVSAIGGVAALAVASSLVCLEPFAFRAQQAEAADRPTSGPGPTSQMHPGDSTATETDDVLRALDDYTDAFGRGDVGAAARYIYVPLLWMNPQQISSLGTVEEVEKAYGAVIQSLKAQGYSRSTWAERHLKMLGPSMALFSGVVVRFKADGAELGRAGATYLLRKVDGTWKIVALTAHAPEAVIRPAP